ncbi:hypothetical protein CNR22_06505 [Sphingobacteriaceae bacterium]|nr:hypothetical protein CNR22_06505 [Sphingobacteriaceae bacterium]
MSRLLFLALILLPFFGYTQIPTNGLIGAWPFSGSANDISGSANHGTVTGASLVPDRCGVPNAAYNFNGSSDYIQMLSTGPTGTLSRSLSFWAKTSNTISGSSTNAVVAFDYGTATGAGDTYQIVWNYCGPGVGLDVSNQALIRGNVCLENGAWHHIVAVMNATASTSYSNVAFYIDGVLQTGISCSVGGVNASINTGTTYPITIGRGATSAVRYFNGVLDDFYLYDRAISQAEVLQLYTITPCQMPVAGSTLVCPYTTNIYSVSPVSNASYTWSLPGGWFGTSSTNTISVYAGGSAGTISVAASSTCGALNTSTLAVSTLVQPTVSISSSPPVLCSGGSATLTATGATNYTWLPGGSTTSTMLVSSIGVTTFTLAGKNTNSCVELAIYTAFVSSTPTISVLKPPALCNGASLSFTANGADTYTWQPGNLTGSLVAASPTTTTNYTVVGTSLNSCTANAVAQVTVPSVIVVTVSAGSPTSCPGQSVTLIAGATGGTGTFTFNWTGGPATATNVVHENSSGTYIYTVTVTDANNCSATTTLSVDFISTFTLSSLSTAICFGATETLSVTGANTYTWYPGALTGSTYTVSPTTITEYTVIGTSVLGCTASASQTVTIKPVPTLSFNTSTITCGSLGSATVTASGTPGPFSFSWTPTSQIASVASNLYPGVYTVSVFDAGTNCTFAPTTTFNPLIPLTGTVSATNSLLCHGATTGTASIALSGGSGSQSYFWTDANGTVTVPGPTSLAAGVNTIYVIDNLTYCSVTNTFLVTQPAAFTLNIAASSSSVCIGGSITFTALNSGGTPGYTYTWTSGSSSSTQTVTESSPSIYVYTVTSTDANNCISTKTVSGKFVVNPIINVTSVQICPLANGTLLASGATTYSWNTGSQANPLVISPPSTTQYTVVGATAGCTSSAVGDVTVKPVPTVSFTSNSPVCQDDSLVFSPVNTHSLYNWTGPSGFTSTLSSVSLYHVLPSQSGNYILKVTAANSCTASVNKLLTINPTPSLSASASTVCEGLTCNYHLIL